MTFSKEGFLGEAKSFLSLFLCLSFSPMGMDRLNVLGMEAGRGWGSVDCLQGQVQQGPRGAFAATHEVQFS